MGKNYYAILGVDSEATREDVSNAFRKLAIKYHPLRDDQDLANKSFNFAQVCEAYDVLSNPDTKQLYDQYGEEILKEGAPTAQGALKGGYAFHGNSLEIFRQFFGTSNPYCEITLPIVRDEAKETEGYLIDDGEIRDNDIVVKLNCTLLEFYYGCTKQVEYTRRQLRKDGKTTKEVEVQKEIHIQPGFDRLTVLRFPNKGHEGFAEVTSGLVVMFEELPEQDIKREGNDLIQTHHITLQDALQASSVSLVTLTGDRVELSVDEIITPQTKKKVEGMGMPIYVDKDYKGILLGRQKRGDLYVRFNIKFPKSLSQEQKDELTELLAEEN